MKITYIAHSGFLVETQEHLLLFDYDKGNLPELPEDKPLCIFVSHRHGDHFNPEIFRLADRDGETWFLLSYDIRLTPGNCKRWGMDEKVLGHTVTLRANEKRKILEDQPGETKQIMVETLKSTDEGVAFMVTDGEDTIYHAGDLNWWHWEGEDKAWLRNMEINFKREVEKLAGRRIDAAFLPLDDRQGKWFSAGMDWYLRSCSIRCAFPMHFWEDRDVVRRFCALECRKDYDTVIFDTGHEKNWVV